MLTALGHGWLNVGSRGKDARVQLDSTCELRRLAWVGGYMFSTCAVRDYPCTRTQKRNDSNAHCRSWPRASSVPESLRKCIAFRAPPI